MMKFITSYSGIHSDVIEYCFQLYAQFTGNNELLREHWKNFLVSTHSDMTKTSEQAGFKSISSRFLVIQVSFMFLKLSNILVSFVPLKTQMFYYVYIFLLSSIASKYVEAVEL